MAFARDSGVVASRQLSQMHPRLKVPVWALCANSGVVFIIGCIYLGSSTAFNAFIGTGLMLQLLTFAIPTALLLGKRGYRDREVSNRASVHVWLRHGRLAHPE